MPDIMTLAEDLLRILNFRAERVLRGTIQAHVGGAGCGGLDQQPKPCEQPGDRADRDS